ncbi:5_t:CDS:2, partial [Racocetra fulgida]
MEFSQEVIDFSQEIVNLLQELMDFSQESVEILYDEIHKGQDLHQLSLDINIFASVNCWFTDDCHEEIRHLVVNDWCDLMTIQSLLSAKYPDQLFLTQDLANVVAQFQHEYQMKGIKEAICQHIEHKNLNQYFNLWTQDQINYNDNIVL